MKIDKRQLRCDKMKRGNDHITHVKPKIWHASRLAEIENMQVIGYNQYPLFIQTTLFKGVLPCCARTFSAICSHTVLMWFNAEQWGVIVILGFCQKGWLSGSGS